MPFLTPSFDRSGVISAISAGKRDTNAPELKPKKHAKTMMSAFDCAGIHSAKMKMIDNSDMMVNMLKRPILSARAPGIVRPKILAALRPV